MSESDVETPAVTTSEFYYPSAAVIERARLKDWDALARYAAEDLQGFVLRALWHQLTLQASAPFDLETSHVAVTHRSFAGLSAPNATSFTTRSTATRRRNAAISWP